MDFHYRLFDKESFCITSYNGISEHVVIPDNINVTVLFDDLFKGHPEILSVQIPNTITDIGGFVFDGCTNLKEIVLPSGLRNMWQYAMTRCGIESITIPGSVKSIVPFTFFQCTGLKKVVFEEGTIRICAWAFKDCTSLQDVWIPETLTDIHEQAFEGCVHVKIHKI